MRPPYHRFFSSLNRFRTRKPAAIDSDDSPFKTSEMQALEASLGRAIVSDELRLMYQPKFETRTGRITGAEALLRWQHPELGLLQPAQFIPYAEDTGVILPLSRWVLQHACSQNMLWERMGLPPLRMAVNLSARQFNDPRLSASAARLLYDVDMEPHRLELEITESIMSYDPPKTLVILAALKKTGIRIALDNFGIGYSSLSHLQEFPIDIVKIDRSAIQNVPGDLADTSMTEAILDTARKLNVRAVAEGVETAEQVAFLQRRRCDDMQGFFFSQPLEAAAFARLVEKNLAR